MSETVAPPHRRATAASSDERFPWIPILALAAAGVLALTVELSPAGLLTRIAPDLHASVAATGSLTALYSLGNAVLVLPLTALALRIPRRMALTATLLVFVLGNILVAVSGALAPALIGRFIAGGAHGLLMALAPAVATRMVSRRQEARALSLVIGANTVGIAFGAPLASFVGNTIGWRASFVGAAIFALLCAVALFLTVPRERAAANSTAKVSIIAALRLPGVLRFNIAMGLLLLAYMAVLTYLDPYLERLGVPPVVTSLSLFIFGVFGLGGVALVGRIASRSRMLALISTPAAMAIAFVIMAFGIRALPVVFAVLALWGMAFSGIVLAYQQTILVAGHRAPETVMSIAVVFLQGGMTIGALLGGVAVERFGVTSTPLVGLGAIVIALLLLIGTPRLLRAADAARDAHDAEQATNRSDTAKVAS
jgi:predicted MFS family arabinose efflux permease